jgi:hypothetical protein
MAPLQIFSSLLEASEQGCPLSSFLFLIVVKGLRKLINNAKSSGIFKGLHFSDSIFLTHILFVDDVMIFGAGSQ